MICSVHTLGVTGINGYRIQTECYISNGLPGFDIVGLPDAAVKEARERVRAAAKSSGMTFPVSRITVNLAPANLKKAGTHYDLPILLGILSACGLIRRPSSSCAFLGELSLDGQIRPISGVLPMAIAAKRAGFETLYVPADTVFEKADITTGAGRLTVDNLSAATMNFELGAGEVKIDTLIATTAVDIEGGAGKITISGGALHNLDLEMGVGQFNLTSALTGECDFDLGVGESNITVIGNKDDYKLDMEKGIGNITVDGASVSNIRVQGKGNNSIEVSGGIGAINLKFKESDAK